MRAKIEGYSKPGVVDFVNDTTAPVEAMTVLTLGKHIGIAAGDIPVGEKGAVNVEGVFFLPKKAGAAIDLWADVAWTEDGCSASGDVHAGLAVAAAEADDEYVRVAINMPGGAGA